MSHIIGRPNDDLLDVMLGHGADPEQAFIGGSEQGLEEGDARAVRRADIRTFVSHNVCPGLTGISACEPPVSR